MKMRLKRFLSDEAGLEPIEYALMAALVALAMIGGAIYLAGKVSGTFQSVGDAASVTAVAPTAPVPAPPPPPGP